VYVSKQSTWSETAMHNAQVKLTAHVQYTSQVTSKMVCIAADLHPRWPHMSSPVASDTMGP
jgi:hypothetical protein